MHRRFTTSRWGRLAHVLLALAFVFSLAGCSGSTTPSASSTAAPAATQEIILASTTSTQDSGLFDVLIPAFEKANPEYKVKVIAVGTGEALKLGETKDADVLLVHAKADEEKFVADGLRQGAQGRHVQRLRHRRSGSRSGRREGLGGHHRRDARHREGRQGRQGRRSSRAATTPARTRRSSSSGRSAGVEPTPTPEADKWYLSTGQGMGETLKIAVREGRLHARRPRDLPHDEGRARPRTIVRREGQGAAQPVRRHRRDRRQERGRRPGVLRLGPGRRRARRSSASSVSRSTVSSSSSRTRK